MNQNRERQQAEQLDAFLTARLANGAAPTTGLSDQETQAADHLVRLAESAQPDPAFTRQLESRLRRSAISRPSPSPRLRWWPVPTLAAALVVAIVFVFVALTQPPTANAQEIVDKARAAANLATNTSITGLELHQTSVLSSAKSGTLKGTTVLWFQSPNRWRAELALTATGLDGKALPDQAVDSISVVDGTSVWYLDRKRNTLTINPLPANSSGQTNISDFGPLPASLNALFAQASSCFNPVLKGNDTVAGRSTYVVDLGAMKCAPSNDETNGRSVIWVDQET